MTDSQLRNGSVDAFRLLAALCVIILHLRFQSAPSQVGVGLRLMSRWAIPFFFMVSGYFLAAKYSKTGQLNVLPTVERLIWMFILWVLIYSPFVVLQHDFTTLLKIITSSEFIFFGLYSHMWFLPSLLFGYLFVSFCYHYHVKFLLPIISALALLMGLISGAYKIFDLGVPLDYEAARTWLAIPFLYFGFLLYQKGRPNWWVSILLIVFGAGLQIVEAKYLYSWFKFSAYDHQFLIGTIPFAIGMTSLALNDLKFLQQPLLSQWGSEYSLGVYLIHPAIIFVLTPLISNFVPALGNSAVWQVLSPVVVLCLALLILDLLHKYLPQGFNFLFGIHLARDL